MDVDLMKVLYISGTLVLAAGTSEDDDTLWTISCDAFPFQMLLKETTVGSVDLLKEKTHWSNRTTLTFEPLPGCPGQADSH
jgi:hypothetical protein